MKAKESIEASVTIVLKGLDTIRERNSRESAPTLSIPSNDLAERAMRGCFNSRTGKWRATKPTKDDDSRLLWQLVKFHRGSGSLWGFPFFEDSNRREELDTLAIVLLGGKSNAACAWDNVIHRS